MLRTFTKPARWLAWTAFVVGAVMLGSTAGSLVALSAGPKTAHAAEPAMELYDVAHPAPRAEQEGRGTRGQGGRGHGVRGQGLFADAG